MQIRQGWEEIKLNDALELIRNGYSGTQIQQKTDFPVTRIETISDGYIDFNKVGYVENVSKSYLLNQNDILISNINSVKHIGKIAMYIDSKPLYHGMNLLILRIKNLFDKKYIYYSLIFQKKWFERMAAQAVNQASINQHTLVKCPLLVPKNKAEQKKIAEILSITDDAIEKTEQLIKKYRNIKQGLMQDLFRYGIDENGQIRSENTHKFKDSPLGRIPDEWNHVSIDDLLKKNILLEIQDGNHGELHPKEADYVQEGIPFVMASDISNGYIDFERCKKITKKQFKSLRIGFAKANDILLSHKASIGFTAIVPDWCNEIMLTPQVTYYRINKDNVLSPKFLYYFFQSNTFQHPLENYSKQSTRSYIGILMQRKLSILLPSTVKEQKAISSILLSADELIKKEDVYLNKLYSLKQGLMQDLLTGKVRVNHLLN